MPNMNPLKTPMREEAPSLRSRCFCEVALGYSAEEAEDEAARCLGCKNRPCVAGCPVGVPIPEMISALAAGDPGGAAALLLESNALPAVCGRVCPQETQCESLCVRGLKGEPVGIGRLERYIADWAVSRGSQCAAPTGSDGKRVAVVGAGPAGLTCAGELARLGYRVTLYEALHSPGGVLVYGIPEFRLPKAVVEREVASLKAAGVSIVTNCVVGRSVTVDELLENHEAVFIGSGAGLPQFMNIPGESLCGVYSANEYLTRVNLMKAYLPESDTPAPTAGRVAVVGGGNVAMDAARCALRLGAASVVVLYRRGRAEMPARREEIHHAEEEGIELRFLTAPVALLGDERGWVRAVRCVGMELGEPDAGGRRRPVVKPGSEYELAADAVIMAIGTVPNPLIRQTTPGLPVNRWGCVEVENEETGRTAKRRVYAGGDAVTGAATVILAMGAGKKAAAAIHADLSEDL